MTRQSKRAQAADLALLEPEEGFEPSTFRLRVETHSSSRCQPGLSWLLRSAARPSSALLTCRVMAGGMTKGMTSLPRQDYRPWLRSDSDRKVGVPENPPPDRRPVTAPGSDPNRRACRPAFPALGRRW